MRFIIEIENQFHFMDAKMETIGAYKTKQREWVFNCLTLHKDKHSTADDIYEYLKHDGTPVGKTTIYRHLDKLVKEGLVFRYVSENGESACYQYVEAKQELSPSFHLKCIDCGKLIHLECSQFKGLQNHLFKEHQFNIDCYKTIMYGTCSKCGKNK